MFIQHKQLKHLSIPAEKVTHLHSSSSSVQLAFAEHPPQLCRSYLLQISGGDKVLVVVAFYLVESQSSIFFIPKFGELSEEEVEEIYEEGYSFIESMGFILTETDYHLLPQEKRQSYWSALPICQPPSQKTAEIPLRDEKAEQKMKKLRLQSRKSLGRFFASL